MRNKMKKKASDEGKEERRTRRWGKKGKMLKKWFEFEHALYTSEAKFKVRLLIKPKGAYSEEHSKWKLRDSDLIYPIYPIMVM